jgi:hypothetical protein
MIINLNSYSITMKEGISLVLFVNEFTIIISKNEHSRREKYSCLKKATSFHC